MTYRTLLDDAAADGAIHFEPQDMPVLRHVLHPALIENPSLFVNLDLLANEEGPIVFGLPPAEPSRHFVIGSAKVED